MLFLLLYASTRAFDHDLFRMNEWCFRPRFCTVRLNWAGDNLGWFVQKSCRNEIISLMLRQHILSCCFVSLWEGYSFVGKCKSCIVLWFCMTHEYAYICYWLYIDTMLLMNNIWLEAKPSNCILIWLILKPFCLSTDDVIHILVSVLNPVQSRGGDMGDLSIMVDSRDLYLPERTLSHFNI